MIVRSIEYILQKELEPFVNCILIQECDDADSNTSIPLYANGYPGIMFQQSVNDFYLLPKQKKLAELFLYGQTLAPASLDVKGAYKCIVFQLYPFASKYLLGIDPKGLNDDCYDLVDVEHINIESYKQLLFNALDLEEQINVLSSLVLELVEHSLENKKDKVQEAIAIIIQHKGLIKVKELLQQLYLNERTFQRNFMLQVGLTPQQFSKIIQFQYSLHLLTQAKFDKLVEVGIDSGFTDQSHFIREFKKYTGQTPRYFFKQIVSAQ